MILDASEQIEILVWIATPPCSPSVVVCSISEVKSGCLASCIKAGIALLVEDENWY